MPRQQLKPLPEVLCNRLRFILAYLWPMYLKRILVIWISAYIPSLLGQYTMADYHRLDRSSDTAGIRLLMQHWALTQQGEADYFIACFNYNVQQARKEVVVLTQEQPEGQHFAVRDSVNGTVAYLSSVTQYDSAGIKSGFDCIDAGIGKHPRRLDMRFGKIYVLGLTENYTAYTDLLIQTLRDGATHGQRWLWSDGKRLKKGNDFMEENAHEYIVKLFNVEADLSANIRAIAQIMTDLWPRSVVARADLGLSYMLSGAFQEALPHLLTAHKLASRDQVVLSNIGYSYKQLGETQKAIVYYRLLKKHGSKSYKELAEKQLAELGAAQ
jgi:tetratricopeptide (TPR) repeat protein